jgi:hypothetical protein
MRSAEEKFSDGGRSAAEPDLPQGVGPATMKCPGGGGEKDFCAAEQLLMVLRLQGSRLAHLG